MNPIILIGLLGAGALALVASAKKTSAAPAKPGPVPPGGFPVPNEIDVGKMLAQAFNDMAPSVLTPDQVQKVKVVFQDFGVDDKGKLRTKPALWARDAALELADELDQQGVPPGVSGTIRTIALGAMALPDGPSTIAPQVSPVASVMSGCGFPLGSLSGPEMGGFGDWWESFVQRWSGNWWRR
jgi:hypothetical protein